MPRLRGSERTASPTIGVIACSIVFVSLTCTKPATEPTITTEEGMASRIYLDAHAHLGSCDLFEGKASCAANDPERRETCDPGAGLVTTADQYLAEYPDAEEGSGSTLAQILSMAYQWSSPDVAGTDYNASDEEVANVECENDYVVEQAELHPDRLLPFCSVNPKKSYAVHEVRRCAAELDVAGLKLHFSSSKVDVRDEQTRTWLIEVLQAAAAAGLPVIVHFGDLDILCGSCEEGAELDRPAMIEAMSALLEGVLPAVPGLRLTFAHVTGVGNFPDWTQATFQMLIAAYRTDLRLRQVDLYVDLAAVFTTGSMVNGNIPAVTDADLAILGRLLTEWGLDRVLWGSDLETDGFGDIEDAWSKTGLSAADFDRIASAKGSAALLALLRDAFPDPCEGLPLGLIELLKGPSLRPARTPWLALRDPKSRCERRAFCARLRRVTEAPSTRAPVPGWSYISDWLEWRDREIGSGLPDLLAQEVFDCAREKSDPEIWNRYLLQRKSARRDQLGWPHFRITGGPTGGLEGHPSAWPFARVRVGRDADVRGFDLSYVVLQLGLTNGDHERAAGLTVDQTTDLTGTILVVPVRPGKPGRNYTSTAFFPWVRIVGRDPGQPERVFSVDEDVQRLWEQQNGRDLHYVRSRIR